MPLQQFEFPKSGCALVDHHADCATVEVQSECVGGGVAGAVVVFEQQESGCDCQYFGAVAGYGGLHAGACADHFDEGVSVGDEFGGGGRGDFEDDCLAEFTVWLLVCVL